jgi:hypothetical protein
MRIVARPHVSQTSGPADSGIQKPMDGAARLRLLHALEAFLQAVRRRRTWQDTDRLLVLLGGIADPELRLHRFGEHLRAGTPEEAAWTIAELWDRVAAGERLAQTVCLGLLDEKRLARVLGTDHLRRVQAVLKADGDPSAGLFITTKPRRDLQEDETVPRPKEPVGFRISLARRPVARVLDQLLFDPDARVVRTILGNPRLTEAEVVKLAASRRAASEVLDVIAQDDRWIARYPVKVALANNPTTPLRVVLGLLPYLLHQDLRAVAAGSSRPEVRKQAASLLSQRPGA